MKKIAFIAFMFAFALALTSHAYAEPVANVQDIQGQVFVHVSGAAPDVWTAVTQNTPVSNGDSVKTTAGSCSLVYSDQATFRLDANTNITVEPKADTQDIRLNLGLLKAKINKEKVTKPFQVVTPTAVGAVRGTTVDFGFNEQGVLTADLHDGGPVQVYNDEAGMTLDLKDGNQITVTYNKEKGVMVIGNSCNSKSKINFSILGTEYGVDASKSQEVNLQTAAGPNNPPDTTDNNDGNEKTPNEDPPPPSSPTQ